MVCGGVLTTRTPPAKSLEPSSRFLGIGRRLPLRLHLPVLATLSALTGRPLRARVASGRLMEPGEALPGFQHFSLLPDNEETPVATRCRGEVLQESWKLEPLGIIW